MVPASTTLAEGKGARNVRRSSSGNVKALAGCVVAAVDDDLRRKARRLGARITKIGNDTATHIVTARALAAEHGVQVRPEWLAAVARGVAPAEATEAHSLSPLEGLEIVPSGVSPAVKRELEALAADGGATFTRSLAKSCTHLVARLCKGAKYEHVIKHGAFCAVVTPQWLRDSVEAGRPLDERQYRPPDDPATKKSPIDEFPSGSTEASVPAAPVAANDQSSKVVHKPVAKRPPRPPRPSSGEIKLLSPAKPTTTLLSPKVVSITQSPKKNTRESSNSTFDPADSQPKKDDPSTPSREPSAVASREPSIAESPPKSSSSSGGKGRSSLVFSSLVMYTTRSPPWNEQAHKTSRRKVCDLSAQGGGTIYQRLTRKVNTIVVVSLPMVTTDVHAIKAAQQRRVKVVGIEWLEKCIEANKVLPTSESPPPQWDATAAAPATQSNSLFRTPADPLPPEPTSNIFLGARITLGPLALRDVGCVTGVRADLVAGRGKVLPHDAGGFCTNGVPTHVMCAASLLPAERAVVDALRAENARIICVTREWLAACKREQSMLSATACVLFRPLARTDCPDLAKCKVTLSGFQSKSKDRNRRRETLEELVRLMGASYSARMGKKNTTVLVADDAIKPSASEKIAKAREWDIPVVSHSWLLACADRGERVPYSQHPLLYAPKKLPTPAAAAAGETTARPPKGRPPRQPVNFTQGTQPPPTPMPDAKAFSIFQNFADTLKVEQDDVNVPVADVDPPSDEAPRPRSASVSLDAREWSGSGDQIGSASQSQVIVHRDLTPPPSPAAGRRSRRSLPGREVKAKRLKLGQ